MHDTPTLTLRVSVLPNAKKNRVVESKPGYLQVSLRAKPEHGEANNLLILALAEYYNVPAENIQIITGLKSRRKLVTIR